MTKTPRGRYSQELRQQAVTLAVEDGFGVSKTARRLSISLKTLANFATYYRRDKQGFALKPGVSEQDAELVRLKKENALLRMERDILKKRRRTLPRNHCEVRRSQRFATPISCPFWLPGFARTCQWVRRLLKRDAAPSGKTIRLAAEVLATHQRTRGTYGANSWQAVAPSNSGRSNGYAVN